jgi:hypothetical protein
LRGSSDDLANGMTHSLGIHDHEHAILLLSGQALKVACDREPKVFADLVLPDAEALVPQVNFEKGTGDPRGGHEFHISVGPLFQLVAFPAHHGENDQCAG